MRFKYKDNLRVRLDIIGVVERAMFYMYNGAPFHKVSLAIKPLRLIDEQAAKHIIGTNANPALGE